MALKSIQYDNKTFDISYEIVNQSSKKDIIILHGWGSNKDIMSKNFKNYLPQFRHIYVDLPGFGKSPTQYVLTTDDYTNIMEIFLKTINASKDTIMGHSYGGKVATKLNPKNLILLSSAGIVEEKSAKVKRKIKMAKFFKALGLGAITKIFRSKDVDNMSENMYATFKNVLNEDFTEDFKNFLGKAYIFWGESDTATSLASGEKIASLIKNSEFKSYEGTHFFFVEHAKDISERVENGIL
ncbi:alpha/beta fold hydrolase [Arcobacter sp. F2176]|uniref:alpha/beta fold hydrolase n=1 Tax=Arcobacter sp. F2176 TaxID=2044511 RepID=UPI00100B624F|nr:alpha/beta hydrolase [Arcobacter sp. F2176]RXJ79029.1 2-hydroxy-6-oxohepta-2,4-dienoate hydrolase [Arcobacter sp. F2176]